MDTGRLIKRAFDAAKAEPIAVAALVVSMLATAPFYIDYFKQRTYTVSFECSEVTSDNPSLVVEGDGSYDFLALHTSCDVSNLDNQTVSIKSIDLTGIWKGGHVYDYPALNWGKQASERFRIDRNGIPVSVVPGEVFLFDAFYLIPITTEWRKENEWCEALDNNSVVRFWEATNCLQDLRDDVLFDYISNINFNGGGGGTHPFRDFGVRITLTNGSVLHRRIQYDWTFGL